MRSEFNVGSGIYWLHAEGTAYRAYCDMETAGACFACELIMHAMLHRQRCCPCRCHCRSSIDAICGIQFSFPIHTHTALTCVTHVVPIVPLIPVLPFPRHLFPASVSPPLPCAAAAGPMPPLCAAVLPLCRAVTLACRRWMGGRHEAGWRTRPSHQGQPLQR